MNTGPRLVIPGALIGSMIVASLGLMITSGVKAESLPAPAPLSVTQLQPAAEQIPASEPDQEDLFEESIAYTPEQGSDNDDQSGGGIPTACQVSDRFPPSILQWCEYISSYAEQQGMPANLIAAVMLQESGGKPLAYSHSGAVGLMQVMPRDGIAAKFMCKNGPCFTNRPSIDELQDPEFNVSYGTKMLAGLVGRFGNYRDALKSYGPMDVGYSYADKVIAIWERYE
jgi:hypothetical protein